MIPGVEQLAYGSLVGVLILASPTSLHAKQKKANVSHDETIPTAHFKSWSLFLACNPVLAMQSAPTTLPSGSRIRLGK
jgi:hypothetical protein